MLVVVYSLHEDIFELPQSPENNGTYLPFAAIKTVLAVVFLLDKYIVNDEIALSNYWL